eukprot:scaffold32683_cov20-Tisochrysis_lutea.AAC.3
MLSRMYLEASFRSGQTLSETRGIKWCALAGREVSAFPGGALPLARAQAEGMVAGWCELAGCEWHCLVQGSPSMSAMQHQAVQGSPSMSATQHQVLINQMGQMERELTWVRAELGRQANYARAAFADQDHVQYCQEQLQ